MTNANELTFGIEIETAFPLAQGLNIGPYHGGYQVPWLPQGWKAERDGSIDYAIGYAPCEFVSPILKGAEGIEQVVNAVREIRARGGRVNASCGIHITVGFNGDAKHLARLVTLFANHEQAIFASTGTKSRENGMYCRPVKHNTRKNSDEAIVQLRSASYSAKYSALNLRHLAQGKARIEVRAFAGSLNATKIVGHICTVLGLFDLAANATRKGQWEYQAKPGKPGPWDKAGHGKGRVELDRLFYKLGWTKGHAKRAYGIPAGVEIKDSMKKLRKLADQYDAR